MANVLPACYMQMASISNIQYEVEGRKLVIRGIGFTFMLSIRRVVISGYRIRKYEYYYGRYLLELLRTVLYNVLWLCGVLLCMDRAVVRKIWGCMRVIPR